MPCSCAGPLSAGTRATPKTGETALNVPNEKLMLIVRIIENLPDMPPDVVDFWIGLGSQEELKKILAALASPKTLARLRKSSQSRLERSYGEINS